MDDILLNVGGKEFYFDIDQLANQVQYDIETKCEDNSKETNEEESLASLKIDVTKYEMYRDLVGALLSYNDIVDDKMGMMGLNQLPIPFKLSFNTLLMKGIIKEL
tara:strand:- start:1312 stop:1626 length:315 start_codon:yes stop_codon:yes gene_type:complete